MRDVVGTVWIDEADRVMVRAQGQFLNDFKLGGGLVADVRKGTNFEYQATRVGDGVWLPAAMDGKGSVRVMLFANFNGHMHVTTSDYRRFRTSATIVGSHGVIGPDGVPASGPARRDRYGAGPNGNAEHTGSASSLKHKGRQAPPFVTVFLPRRRCY